MKTVDILRREHGFKYPLRVNLIGKGKLNDETIDSRVFVQCVNFVQGLLLEDVLGKFDQGAVEPNAFARFDFVTDVGATRRIVSNDDGCEMGLLGPVGYASLDFFLDFVLDGQGSGLAVNDLHSWLLELSTERG